MPGLRGRHPQAISASGGSSRWAGGDRPELMQVLRNNNQRFAAAAERLNGRPHNPRLWIARTPHAGKQVGVEEDHSSSLRV